jgi:arylsulfatase
MNRRTFLQRVGGGLLAANLGARVVVASSRTGRRPNVLLILCDDMGFSDLGCFGSEIHTPNLDRLAAGGLRMTQFYNAARCCPTRASMLTGLYQHQAGVGKMPGIERTCRANGTSATTTGTGLATAASNATSGS